jgi:hypothetical protein
LQTSIGMFECPGTALRQPRYRHPDEQGLGRSVFGEGKTPGNDTKITRLLILGGGMSTLSWALTNWAKDLG